MSWAQLTNRPNNGSQGYYNNNDNNNNNHGGNDNWNRNNNSNNNRKVGLRTINNGNYSNSYRSNNKRNNNRNQYNRNKHHNNSYNNNYNHHNNNQPPRRSVGLTGNKKRNNDINYVILDSGAFIGRQNFFNNFNSDTTYYMTQAVQNEITDKASRQFLESFPYHITIKDPDPQSITFVNKFCSKNPNLRSLSKVDKGVIALAHTLEQEYSGYNNGGRQGGIRPQFNKRQQPQKAMTVMQGQGRRNNNNNKHEEKSKEGGGGGRGKPVKKSKTGRIHTEAKQLDDTGVRLAMLKKVVPFQFDDFMTLSQQKYGEKYGQPTSQDIQAMGHQSSPVRSPLKARIMNEAKEKERNDDTKERSTQNEAKQKIMNKQDERKENKYKYKPNVKAMTEAPVQEPAQSSQSPLSKAQRRRRRKKAANAAKQDKVAESSGLTEENILKFQKIEEESDEDDNGDIMKELKLNEIKELKEQMQRQKEFEDELKSNAESVKSELDKMIEEDEAGLFNETAVLMNSLSEKSVKLKLTPNPDMPSLSQSQSLPTTATAETIAFGTMFPTATIAEIAGADGAASGGLTSPRSPMEAFNSPLPPLVQNQTSDHHLGYAMPAAKPNQNVSPNPNPSPAPNASASPQPVITSNKSLPLPQPIRPSPNNTNKQSQQAKKMTVNDAWDGPWLGPENYKPVPKNQNKKKTKLKNVADATNNDSSVAVITVDQTLQRAMVEMGLRVMSTSKDRQYGNPQGGNNQRHNNRNDAHNGEPVDYVFRCFGCFNTEHDTTRTHCRWCGGQTFQRVAIYQDENGKHHHRYYYRDRYAQKYLEKHSLVPRGAQLVKYNQKNGRNQVQGNNNQQQRRNQKKKNKKRGYLSQNNNNFRGGGGRW